MTRRVRFWLATLHVMLWGAAVYGAMWLLIRILAAICLAQWFSEGYGGIVCDLFDLLTIFEQPKWTADFLLADANAAFWSAIAMAIIAVVQFVWLRRRRG